MLGLLTGVADVDGRLFTQTSGCGIVTRLCPPADATRVRAPAALAGRLKKRSDVERFSRTGRGDDTRPRRAR